jgi:hypothetical protein
LAHFQNNQYGISQPFDLVPEGLEYPVEQITERVFEKTSEIFKSVACPVNKQGVFLFILPLKNLIYKIPLNGRAKGEPPIITTPMTLVGHLTCSLARTAP